MNKDNFRLDGSAKNKINHEFSRPDDTKRVNTAGKRPARPEPRRMPTGGQGTPPRRPAPQQGARPKRPTQSKGQYPPYPPQSAGQRDASRGRPAPQQGVRPKRPAQSQGQYPPYPPQGAAQPEPSRRRPAPAQRPVPPQPTKPLKKKRRRAARQEYIPPEQALPPYMQPEYEPEPEPELPKKPKKHRLAKFLFRVAVLCVVVIFLNVLFLYYRGELWFNEPRKRDYPVRGAVVTEKLGKVDWEKFAGQSMSFVYIRATRGTEYTDPRYKDNRRGANNTDLLSGFYHEFVFGKDGKQQAEHYIRQVGDLDGKLRPMVKVRRYGIYLLRPVERKQAAEQLQAFIDRVEEEYGVTCVIQCDSDCYKRYIGKDFSEYYDIWLISHFTEPETKEFDWTLWEYNPRVRSTGYSNRKKYYCMSVFRKSISLGSFMKDFLIGYEE